MILNKQSTHNYWVGWYDSSDGKRGAVDGEGPMEDWAEAEEVCAVRFRPEGDGLKYYVSDELGTPVEPSLEEALWLLEYHRNAAEMSAAEVKLFKRLLHTPQQLTTREVLRTAFNAPDLENVPEPVMAYLERVEAHMLGARSERDEYRRLLEAEVEKRRI